MTRLTPKSSTLPPLQQAVPILAALVVAGLGGNYCRYEFFFNIQFIFGSIFAMLALQILGVRFGSLAALIISSITYQLWNHPYAIVVMTGEVMTVGLLFRRRGISIVTADALYWIVIGMPLVYLFHHRVMDLPVSNATITMVKQAVNGIANTLVARLIFIAASCRLKKTQFSLQEVVFNLLALVTLATALFLLIGQGKSEVADTERSIRGSLGMANQRVSVNLRQWLEDHSERMTYLATQAAAVPVPLMQAKLDQATKMNRDFLRIGLMDEGANSVAFSPAVDEQGQPNIGKNYSERPFIPTLKQTLKPMFSEVVIGKIGRPQPIVIALAPVVVQGHYAGFIAGVLDQQRVHNIIALNASSQLLPDLFFTLVDTKGRIIATNRENFSLMDTFSRGQGELRPLPGGISQWLPTSHKNISISDQWKESLYIAETTIGRLAEWKLILELPIAPVQKRLYEKYAAYLAEVLALLMATLVLAKLMSQWVVASLEALKTVSADIPSKLATNADIEWPASGILETAALVDNFREMSGVLARQLNEIRDMNVALEERVNERTRALRASEERLRALNENLADGMVYQLDSGRDGLQRRFSYLSPAVERLHGLTVAEVQGNPQLLYGQVVTEHQALVADKEAQALASNSTFDVDVKVRLPSGEVRWRRFLSVPRLVAEGNILWDGIELDITEHKRMEESLRKSEALLKQTQRVSRVGGWEYDVARQKMAWTDEVYRIYGVDATYDPSDIPQAVSFYSAQDQAVVASTFQRAVEQGESYDLELQFLAADGRRKWVRTMGQAECAAGKTVRVFGHIMDITDRKQAEIEREQYFKFFTTSADLMCIADPNGCFIRINPACRQTLGYSEEELVAKPFIEFVLPADRQSTLVEMARQLERSYSSDFENRYLCKDGTVRWLSWRASYNKEEGLTYATARDITERKQIEEQMRQSLREKETLLKEVHHRVKNNMAVVSSLLKLQAKQIKDDRLKGMFEESQQRIKSISLVHEKLYRSKDLSCIDFGDYISTIVRELRSSYRREGGVIGFTISADSIVLDIDTAIPCGLIINELITNALKYAFPGEREGSIAISLTAASNALYTMTVKDNGVGLPPGFDRARIGTLGLQLVEALAKQLRGTMEIKAEAGTEVVISFWRSVDGLARCPTPAPSGSRHSALQPNGECQP